MSKRVKRAQKVKHGKYTITVFEEREIEPFGFVAYVEWGKGKEFCAHVRSPSHGLGRYPTQQEALDAAVSRCEQLNVGEPYQTLLAEYCDGPFYMGWHLYLRNHPDGRRNDDGEWGWLQQVNETEDCRVRQLVIAMGHTPPSLQGRGSDRLEEWFADAFPLGIRVIVGEYRKLIPVQDKHEPTLRELA